MAKVLRILNRFNIGGPTHNATYLTKFLEPDFETKLIAGKKLSSEASSEHVLEHYNLDFEILDDMQRSIHLFRDLKVFFKIRNIIKSFQPKIVHTHASKSGALGRLAAMSCGVPIIIHTFHGHVFHSYFGPLKTKIYILIERLLASKSSAIIAISDIQKKELVDQFNIADSKKVHVIPLGFDLKKFQKNTDLKRESFRKEFDVSDDEIAIGIVGRLTKIKNHIFFLKVVKQIKINSNKKIKIFLIGDGEDKENLLKTCEELSLATNLSKIDNKNPIINFTSWRKDMDVIYSGLDIVALTSLNEGTPVTLIEAQAANKPIITTNVGGVTDVVNNKTAIVCNLDLHEFSQKIIKLVEDDNLREEMSKNGFEYVNSKFSYQRLVSDMRKLYNSFK